jgi:uncharacterized protein YndB with AHSA1/START domain
LTRRRECLAATVLPRTFDAPRDRVFAAWTDPKQLAPWWGPRACTVPVCELDLRPGGRIRIVLRSAEGEDYPIVGEYLEVVRPSRIVMRRDRKLTTVLFDEHFGKTTVTLVQTFETPAEVEANRKSGAEQGWPDLR